MNIFFKIILKVGIIAIFRSIIYNFRYLPLKQALYFPIVVGKRSKIIGEGIIEIDSEKIEFALIKIGVNCGNAIDERSKTVINVKGSIIFGGKADIWKDTRIMVLPKGNFKVGDGFLITGRILLKFIETCQLAKIVYFQLI